MTSLRSLESSDAFLGRHIGPNENDISSMLATVGAASLEDLTAQTVPAAIRFGEALPLPEARDEADALALLKSIASKNTVAKSLIGQGYYDTLMPPVLQRNVLENPGWYTAYTPYQAEIAQGRLEALLNYQQMVMDFTGFDLANASLLDEATAAAEAMAMAKRVSKSKSQAFFVDARVFPHTLDVLQTRAAGYGFELIVGDISQATAQPVFGALLQYPAADGAISNLSQDIAAIKAQGGVVAVAADLLALALLTPPAELGADIALGSTQRFGIPMGFGGPHAAYFATRDEYKRAMPGRIIGVSVDAKGKRALRMALQTREQHIRREKANSNICTAQVLLANLAGFYAVWHGPEGIKRIAQRVHRLAALFAAALQQQGVKVLHAHFFDTVSLHTGDNTDSILAAATAKGYLLHRLNADTVSVSFGETSTANDVATLVNILTGAEVDIYALDSSTADALPADLVRQSAYLTHPVFHSHHTETAMMRYLKRLQNRDLALDHSMIALGSCTMKLNAAAEMMPVSWPEFANLHPFAPREHATGYLEMIDGLCQQLQAVTGFAAVSMQPNSGAQGEYAGLLAIRRYLDSQGQQQRTICLIPQSAHGTNPATAQMMGMKVVVVACDENGNVDVADLRAKAEQYSAELACLMITYPSTHGVFEAAIRDICDIIHQHGGQVYMDGANLNALVGLVRPADIGADVSHINLHKTFCIPHGSGAPPSNLSNRPMATPYNGRVTRVITVS
ncbi:MAG: aminomethyl-transferring glycine dehydrogenase, partial [Aquaspirillum sp.]